jgi:GNAT superfamily N-acetyltransferase
MITPAEPSDLMAIRQIAHEVYAAYVPRFTHSPPGPVIADYAMPVSQHRIFVFRDPDVRAFIVCYREGDDFRIDNVAVLPRYQRSGIGRQMLTFAESHAHAEGCNRLAVSAHIAMAENIAFYRQHGFIESGRETDENGIERIYFGMRLKK